MKITSFDEYQKTYQKSVDNPEEYWADIAGNFQWRKPWIKTLEWNFTEPNVKWFIGG